MWVVLGFVVGGGVYIVKGSVYHADWLPQGGDLIVVYAV